MTRITLLLITIGIPGLIFAQGFAFGAKGGLSVGFQKWTFFQRDPMFKAHGDLFIETLPVDGLFSLYASGGYHPRGTALRNARVWYGNNQYRLPAQEFIFHNISIELGGKQRKFFKRDMKWYYGIGIRGDYNLGTNLDEYREYNELSNSLTYPIDEFVEKVTFGVSVTGGLEWDIEELYGVFLEFSVDPDLTKQYIQPPIPNVSDPYNPGRTRTLPAREIVNTTLELTLGVRFLRKIIYVD